MKIENNQDAFGNYEYTLNQKNLEFKMYYGGNLDLYWEIRNLDVDIDNFESYEEVPLEFRITQDDGEVYSIFSELYESIISSARQIEQEESQKTKALTEETDRLVYVEELDGEPSIAEQIIKEPAVVVWHSDEDENEKDSLVTISLIEGNILITFRKGQEDLNMPGTIAVRFRNNGSKYVPFNQFFMKHFKMVEKIAVVPEEVHKIKLTNNS